jgi:hypothetical protein
MRKRCIPISYIVILSTILLTKPAIAQTTNPIYIDSEDKVPAVWSGSVFHLSHAYPASLPTDPKPWKAFDFATQPKQYMQAVIAYCFDGNTSGPLEFAFQNNSVRTWYNAPGMATGASGREFIHGLTKERSITLQDLDPTAPTTKLQSWAVGFYNPIGGMTLGKVWASPDSPDPSQAKFEDGAVSFKLLFTTATDTQLPFLAGAPEWEANIHRNLDHVTTPPPKVRLLQVDIAVRDSRADSTTGWVFGTFEYRNDPSESDPWKRLVPVGLMWGNDPTLLTQKEVDTAGGLKETWLNQPKLVLPHYGYLNRLNGPVDNPASSCLSCHGTAAFPQGSLVPKGTSTTELTKFFQNVPAEQTSGKGQALDYSLQLSVGMRNFPGSTLAGAPMHILSLPSADASPGDAVLRDGTLDLDAEADRIISFRAAHPNPSQPASQPTP